MSGFDYHKDDDGIVTVTMDMHGPVNTMDADYPAAMGGALDRLEHEKDLRGVIFASAKRTFFAGADLKALIAVKPGSEDELFAQTEATKQLLRRIEQLPVPVAAAINGAALGGGYEICLACNRRIIWDDRAAEVGLPEVTLGLLPGAGGVVRLTNLLGLERALPFLLEGKKLSGAEAVTAGLADASVADLADLIPVTKAWILEQVSADAALQPWDRKGHKIPHGDIRNPKIAQIAMVAPHKVRQKTRGLLPAPERILDTAVQAVTIGFEAALRVESRNFASLVTTPQAKNMIAAFFFQLNEVNGGASRPKAPPRSTINKLGIIGAGMMGQGIAYAAAAAGIDVVLTDVSLEAAERGRKYSERLLDKAIERGKLVAGQKAEHLARIRASDRFEDLRGCDLIVEAVFENMALKNDIVGQAERMLGDGGTWGSNTSTLPISRLAEASSRPENFLGIHFFSPVDKMPLVELIRGEKTSDETLAKAFDFVRQIRKTPIVVNDSVGFFTSRTFAAQLGEAAEMTAEGIDPVRIDNLGKAIGMPVGPLTVADEVSLSLTVQIRESHINAGLIDAEASLRPRGDALVADLVHAHNRGGRYHGEGGYYDYRPEGKAIWQKLRELYNNSSIDGSVPDQDIKDRLLFSSVIEALKCLEEGVLTSVADGNIGSLLGIGAPTWTGGYLQFVTTYGNEEFAGRCAELADRYGPRFAAPDIVHRGVPAL